MRCLVCSIMLLVGFMFANGIAQVEVSGDVEGRWTTDDSPYIVVDDIRIRNGDELVIDPGVEIRFLEDRTFIVNGLLTAIGEEDDRILFTAVDQNEMWQSVKLMNPDNNCEISFCIFEFSEQTGRYNNVDSRGAALYGERCNNLTISNNIFRNTRGSGQGTVCFYHSTGEFTDNHIYDTDTFTEIAVFETSPMLIARNVLENNISAHGAGIFILHDSPLIEDNIIRNNQSTIMGWGTGLYLVHGCSSEVRGNLIYGNQRGGIYIGDGSVIDVFENNVVFDNGGGSGIFIWQNSSLSIRNSIIWGHPTSVFFADRGNEVNAEYSVIEHFREGEIEVGEGVFNLNPDLINPDEDDFNLTDRSFCIDAGDPDSPDDPDGSRADIGAYPFDHEDQFPSISLDFDDIVADGTSEHLINIANNGEIPLWVRFGLEEDWIAIDPITLILDQNVDDDVFVFIDAEDLDIGRYESQIIISSSDPENPFIEISVILEINAGDSPEWDDIPEEITVEELEEISFVVQGSDPDDDDLTINCNINNLPDRVEFEDLGNGRGRFLWQTDYDDAGEYTAIFTLSDGIFDVQEAVIITVINLNRVPIVINPMEDIILEEDQEAVIISTLNQAFIDPDGDELVYFLSPGNGINFEVDQETNLLVQPEQDWNGLTQIVIAVSDGEDAIQDTVLITVISINDPPSAFNLISPPNNEQVENTQVITFDWQTSIDEVEGDRISYNLSLSYANRILTFVDIEDTTYDVDRDLISVDPAASTEITWQVWASDGEDSTRGSELFTAIVAPLYEDKGRYTLLLNADDLPSGTYFILLTAGDEVRTQKITLLR